MILTSGRLTALKPQIEAIGRGFGVSRVRLFGSVARGEAREGSDVDLLVRMDPERSLLDLIGFEQAVGALLGGKVDVVEEGGIHPMLEPTILREARPL